MPGWRNLALMLGDRDLAEPLIPSLYRAWFEHPVWGRVVAGALACLSLVSVVVISVYGVQSDTEWVAAVLALVSVIGTGVTIGLVVLVYSGWPYWPRPPLENDGSVSAFMQQAIPMNSKPPEPLETQAREPVEDERELDLEDY